MVFALLLTILFMNGEALGLQVSAREIGYESRLFDNTKVHTLDIVIDDWDAFLETAQSEVYSMCDVVIDGVGFNNVAIRGKGNTSLANVSAAGSQRFSFKIEFDHYDNTQTYFGLDKLALNNMIQDNTMMKDYLAYTLMHEYGAPAPLCSFVNITVNGEPWGLYLAVEAIEDSFMLRTYGSTNGELYKPDTIAGFNEEPAMASQDAVDLLENVSLMQASGMLSSTSEGTTETQAGTETMPAADNSSSGGGETTTEGQADAGASGGGETTGGQMDFGGSGGGEGGMTVSSADAQLRYAGDDPSSYSSIFASAKTDVTEEDQTRFVAAIKAMNEGDTSAIDVDKVIRYFVVHNYVVNGDSYTGGIVHNYYLHEEDGVLSMIAWDYNLAYGTFQGSDATECVNDDIDYPQNVSGSGDRPMYEWIISNEEYKALYYEYFEQFLDTVDVIQIIEDAYELIAPYVEQDPTKFCSTEEFETAVEHLTMFCQLRTESVRHQLAGEDVTVDASSVSLSAIGTMGGGGDMAGSGGGEGEDNSSSGGGETEDTTNQDASAGGEAADPNAGQTGENTNTGSEGSENGEAAAPTDGADATAPAGTGSEGGETTPAGGTDATAPADTGSEGSEAGEMTTPTDGGTAGGTSDAAQTGETTVPTDITTASGGSEGTETTPSADGAADATAPADGGSEGSEGTETTPVADGAAGATAPADGAAGATAPADAGSEGSEGGETTPPAEGTADATTPAAGGSEGGEATAPAGDTGASVPADSGSAGSEGGETADPNSQPAGTTSNGQATVSTLDERQELMIISAVVLLLGLLIAVIYKR